MPKTPQFASVNLVNEINELKEQVNTVVEDSKPAPTNCFERRIANIVKYAESYEDDKETRERNAKLEYNKKELIKQLPKLVNAITKLMKSSRNNDAEHLTLYRDALQAVIESLTDSSKSSDLNSLANRMSENAGDSCLFRHRQSPVTELKIISHIISNIERLESRSEFRI